MQVIRDSLYWLTPTIKYTLVPNMETLPTTGFRWKTLISGGHFTLSHPIANPKGWYMLNVALASDQGLLHLELQVDYGNGFLKENTTQLTIKNNKLNKRVYFFSQKPVSIRLALHNQNLNFNVSQLTLTKLTQSRARELMLKKLQSRRERENFVGLNATELLGFYNQCFNRNHTMMTYQQWLKHYEHDSLNPSKLDAIYQSLNYKPVISVIMATYKTPPALLQACLDSVIAQHYPHWQLCIADDASNDPALATLLSQYAKQDSRIQFTLREKNGHISAASNSALTLAKGEYIALLDHDDLLAPHALLMMAQGINQHPSAGLLYSDEDKIDEQGNRAEPHFKPDWNRDLFYSHNYITHFCVFKSELVNMVGGFREGVEGSQDYDLCLRVIAHLGNRQIIHIPHVLYHWRAIQGSTALSGNEKSYTHKAGLKALQDFFRPTGIDINVSKHALSNCFRVEWPMPEPKPLVSLIIPTRDGYDLLKQCIDSIYQMTRYPHFEVLIINNQSRCPKTLAYFEALAVSHQAKIIDVDEEFNFSLINNIGVEQANGSIVGLINNDIEILNDDWLDEMVRQASRPDIGCVGAKLYYPDGRIQHAGVVLGIGGVAGHSHKYFGKHHHGYHSRLSLVQNYSAVTAAALLVRKSVYLEVGGLDPELKVAFNDVDFCLKVREAGYRNIWTPFAEMIHHESVSRGFEDTPQKQARFAQEINLMQQRWGEELLCDPCYNPNLTLTHEDFSCRTGV
ncbi:glycosyltransferase family 2 protein [Aeromonas veronii]|uniref:glycosyltransferase family 2 protein n=1 Tax=Aeromonas veronii TaxID=654 RepID=UPI0031FCB7DA